MKALLSKFLPVPVKSALRNSLFNLQDVWGDITGKDGLMPPRRMIYIGDGDFKSTGQEFLRLFRESGLEEQDRVLDVGSGIGRMAIPLIPYLKGKGSYDGLEIVRDGVDWCQKNISPEHPRFRFHWVDVFNLEYNPAGKLKGSEYRFPFPDKSFDFIYLTSVFTHMMPADLENYLTEISRVMADRGTLFVTFFLANEESLKLIKAGSSTLDLRHQGDGYLTVNPDMPEAAVAFPEEYVLRLLKERGFHVRTPVRYGSWCGRRDFLSYQDIVIADRTAR